MLICSLVNEVRKHEMNAVLRRKIQRAWMVCVRKVYVIMTYDTCLAFVLYLYRNDSKQ